MRRRGDEGWSEWEVVTTAREQHCVLSVIFQRARSARRELRVEQVGSEKKSSSWAQTNAANTLSVIFTLKMKIKKRWVSIRERTPGGCSRRALQGSLFCQVISPRAIVGLILCSMIPNAVPCCPAGEHSADHLLRSVSTGWAATLRRRGEQCWARAAVSRLSHAAP